MTITINPAAPAPLSLGDEIVCYGDTNLPSLRVSVAADQTANWFANALGGTAIAIGTTNFVPTQAGLGIHDYHAETSNMLTGCLSADRTKVSLAVVVCPTINWMSSTNIVVEWYGLMTLLSNTDLTLPGGWRTVLAPSGGNRTNHWTNSIVPPPTSTFFRLTNAPAGL